MVMVRAAVQTILEYDLISFVVGVNVLLVLTTILGVVFAALLLFGLTVWALLLYFVLPLLFPLHVVQPVISPHGGNPQQPPRHSRTFLAGIHTPQHWMPHTSIRARRTKTIDS